VSDGLWTAWTATKSMPAHAAHSPDDDGAALFSIQSGSDSSRLAAFFIIAYDERMSKLIHKRHNVSILMYHIVCPAKYRRVVFTPEVDAVLKDVCMEIEKRYEIEFLEIGTDRDQVHFLVQSVPTYSPTKIVRTIKSITAREIFKRVPTVKKQLWGGEFWSDGYYIGTFGQYAGEEQIRRYVQKQGQEEQYEQILARQLPLF